MSFKGVMTSLKALLENDPQLSAFCIEKWGKPLTVEIMYKEKAELSLQHLPKILITRPDVKKDFLIGGQKQGIHTIRLYAGFRQSDKGKGAEELIEFEEKIDDALTTPNPWDVGNALDIRPTESVNDEGKWHPEYFLVMEVAITHDRN